MKLQTLLLLMLSAQISMAQPVLSAATNNPVIGDVFREYGCDTNGVSCGPSGAGVTWNFSSLTVTGTDTFAYIACAPTPYCDSFPGSNIAIDYLGTYNYCLTSSSGLYELGFEVPTAKEVYTMPYHKMAFPLSYNSVRMDSFIRVSYNIPFDSTTYFYEVAVDSSICDAYGTLILPSGTYTNVLRVHQIFYFYDSFYHSATAVFNGRFENYYWYASGIHNPLMTLSDTTGAGPYLVIYTVPLTTAASDITTQNQSLTVYPNPANDVINIHFSTNDAANTSVILTTITGSVAGTISPGNIHTGTNDLHYPVSNLSPGMYILQLISSEGHSACKFVVNR